VNPAGRYVLFGEDGEVVKKKETWEEDGDVSGDYTATDSNLGKLGFRCQTFEQFGGTVTVAMQAQSGKETVCTLSPENFYEANVDAAGGIYTVGSAKAQWDGKEYQVEAPGDPITVGEGQFVLVTLSVTETVVETATEAEETQSEENVGDDGQKERQENQTESGVKQEMTEMGRKPMLLWGMAVIAGILGFMVYKKKRDRHA